MAETKTVRPNRTEETPAIDRAGDFWSRYNKPIIIAAVAIIVLLLGWLAYKKFVQEPNERKASEAIFKSEEYYRMDSLNLALNGDGMNQGFLRIIDRYGSTKAGNLAKFYAGASFLQLGNFAQAEKHLKDFSTDAEQVQARAYKLLGDAYAEQGKNDNALSSYKKAASEFEEDDQNASEYLFMAAYFAEKVANNKSEAIKLYRELKEKYPRTEKGFEAEKYLARLGEYKE
jgi:predicted negative regulator of RcsB-dependent stress response